jgi:2-phospho-L-lactate/phosphoenolpyruvate guanylyltransferase
MVHALLPLKDLVAAKSRLAGVLAPSERRALMQAMAEDVLAVLAAHPGVEGITLLSDDPGASLLAARYGATHWPEQALGASGLNAALGVASRQLAGQGARRILVLHADLPGLAVADIDAVLASQAGQGGLLVGADRHREGTNLLLFPGDRPPAFAFGVGSCARHVDWARRAGIPVRVLQRSGIARDVDVPADLQELVRGGVSPPPIGPATSRMPGAPRLAARLRLALAGIESGANPGEDEGRGR